MSRRKRRKWHLRATESKTFLRKHAPRFPKYGAPSFGGLTFLPVRTPSKTAATHLRRIKQIPKPMVKFCIFFRPYAGIETISCILVVQMVRMDSVWKLKKKNCACIKGTKKYYGWCSPWNLFNSFFITLREHFVTKHITDHKQQYSCERGKTTELLWWWRWWWW